MVTSKTVELAGIGLVTLQKRSTNRTVRLSVRGGKVYVSLPRWSSFTSGITFAAQHAVWIQAELIKQQVPELENGQAIGKLHHLRFEHVLNDKSIGSRVTGTEVVVKLLAGERNSDTSVQNRAAKAAIRALKREAERLLPPRLASLAERHSLTYRSVAVKSLKRRWGSCDSHGAITLNLYLMELPWEYIDYVLLHELTHTQHMNHGPEFWNMLASLQPHARDLARQLRRHHPALGNWQP